MYPKELPMTSPLSMLGLSEKLPRRRRPDLLTEGSMAELLLDPDGGLAMKIVEGDLGFTAR